MNQINLIYQTIMHNGMIFSWAPTTLSLKWIAICCKYSINWLLTHPVYITYQIYDCKLHFYLDPVFRLGCSVFSTSVWIYRTASSTSVQARYGNAKNWTVVYFTRVLLHSMRYSIQYCCRKGKLSFIIIFRFNLFNINPNKR